MSELPGKLILPDGLEVQIRKVKRPRLKGEYVVGHTIMGPEKRAITISSKASRNEQSCFMVHELLHALWPPDDNLEEEHVEETANKLINLVRSNQELFSWILEGILDNTQPHSKPPVGE